MRGPALRDRIADSSSSLRHRLVSVSGRLVDLVHRDVSPGAAGARLRPRGVFDLRDPQHRRRRRDGNAAARRPKQPGLCRSTSNRVRRFFSGHHRLSSLLPRLGDRGPDRPNRVRALYPSRRGHADGIRKGALGLFVSWLVLALSLSLFAVAAVHAPSATSQIRWLGAAPSIDLLGLRRSASSASSSTRISTSRSIVPASPPARAAGRSPSFWASADASPR